MLHLRRRRRRRRRCRNVLWLNGRVQINKIVLLFFEQVQVVQKSVVVAQRQSFLQFVC